MDEHFSDVGMFTRIWRDMNGATGGGKLRNFPDSPTILQGYLNIYPWRETFLAGDSRTCNDRAERK